ncbi:DUF3427 domain-containing protein [Fibrobacter sp.]|uniref:DEAD/DEAH box helicase n=1 Tax=Fibrobacter sp. TaxID=35828 RepID=UPI00386C81B8
MLKTGLYEQVINEALSKEMDTSKQLYDCREIDKTESPQILSKYLSEIIEKGLSHFPKDDTEKRLELTNKIVSVITEATDDKDFNNLRVNQKPEQLFAVENILNNAGAIKQQISMARPETSLVSSSLFTGAGHEPQMMTEIKKEIASADKIDFLVSFIKWSGLVLIYDELKKFTEMGGKLRIITTSYMGATDLKAIIELNKLPNTEIKISYDTERTRLHAKSYIFYRDTGFTTAYVGSSNMSNAAMTSGLEWNLKITAHDQPHTIRKINATFENYWSSTDFSLYTEEDENRLLEALKAEKHISNLEGDYSFDIRPFSYQQEILDKLSAERQIRNHFKNLVVAATGTGKTVISAFDYKRFKQENSHARLLFVAHRKEILKQSIKCFRGVLHDANFGELFFGGTTPNSLDNLFISIETFNSQELDKKTSSDFYDFIIIDEFHHAAAPTYQRLLEYYKPKILLGLTATPERMDGKNVLSYFDNRIAAEIRLPEAIDRKLLCPFHYFGITDEVDLQSVKWSRGGYDKTALSNVYTGNDLRVILILEQLKKYIADMEKVKGLGFCVSKEHAEYMAQRFNKSNIPSIALTADSDKNERDSAQAKIAAGDLKFIFTVDLYNEGVDIPSINTVMFLRPTESLTVFLQQLGRGLRLCDGKDCLTVLDFIGQAHSKYNFESKFAALLGNTKRKVIDEVKSGFPVLPKGCYIQLEEKAERYILDNIRQAVGTKKAIISKIASFSEETGKCPSIYEFLDYFNLKLDSIYSTGKSFARLCVEAEARENFSEEIEDVVTKALPRLSFMDSRRLIEFIIDFLPKINDYTIADFSEVQKKMWQMLQFTIWQKPYEECGFKDLLEGFRKIANAPTMMNEITDLLMYKYEKIDFIDEPIPVSYECPLDLHCSYTRDQILVALDFMKPRSSREGVKYLEDKKTDVFFVTLNKSDKDYSPTTMYNDYAINDNLFHWQSQSTTSAHSPTGKRYINHHQIGTNVMLFVRENNNTKLGKAPYTFLGLVDFVSSEGSKTMNVIWKLRKPMPAKYLKTSLVMAG